MNLPQSDQNQITNSSNKAINKNNRLPILAQSQSPIPTKQKRQNSQSSNSQSIANKRGAIFTNSSPNSNFFYSNQQQQQQQQQVTLPIQIPKLTSLSPNPYNSFKPIHFKNINTPTSTSLTTNNINNNNNTNSSNNNNNNNNINSFGLNLNYNSNFTPNTCLTPKLHYQLLQSSLKKTSNSTFSNIETLNSPKKKVISKILDSDMSVEAASEINDQLNNNSNANINTDTNTNNKNSANKSNSSESIENQNPPSKQIQQSGQQHIQNQHQNIRMPHDRRPSTETLVSQPPPAPNSTSAQPQQHQQHRIFTNEEQILASNLQETYKTILKLEIETQQGCAEVNQRLIENNASSELTPQLWIVYKNVIQLLDNYYDFLLYALSPGSARAGKPLVTNYRILRRMWVYGVVSFLEVLKNVAAIFVEHEICACFVAYTFNIISCLTDPQLGVEGWWAEKLGDLSRMAIALYPARYMDWKVSSVYWYQQAAKTQFGRGKIYYHMCTVENDNLEALMLIGKSVNCRDPFVPTQQYLRMIVDNACSQRNMLSSIEMAMIDFVKIHKILLLPSYNSNQEMITLVSHYSSNFGVDNSNIDYFLLRSDFSNSFPNDKLTFWFQKGPNFALSNIYHLIGFGDSRNPFSKLFELPEALKERKDKKEKRRKSRSDTIGTNNSNPGSINLDPEFLINSTANDQDEKSWFSLLEYINKGVLELSIKMLKQYISGPIQSSTPHVIIWLYFIISVGESLKKYPSAKPMFVKLITEIFPWKKLTPYLNDILCLVRSIPDMRQYFKEMTIRISTSDNERELLEYFAENEKLWEVWKCWGSICFDQISCKKEYGSVFETGIKADIFDLPTTGARYNSKEDYLRYVRILLLSTYICDNFPEFGLKKSGNVFKHRLDKNQSELDKHNNNNNNNMVYFTYFIQDQRLQSLIEKTNYSQDEMNKPETENKNKDKDENQDDVENGEVKNDLFKWVGENDSPKLPTWEYNSHSFMTEFVNNHYPASLAHGDGVVQPNINNETEEEYEEDSDEEEEEEEEEDEEEGEEEDDEDDLDDEDGINDDEDDDEGYHYDEKIDRSSKTVSIQGNFGENMDTALTFISLDTNVWLKHCGRIFKCIRSDIFRLSVPLTVFQELRSLRRSTDATVADSATRAIIIIRQLYNERDVLAVRADGSKATSLNETLEFEQNQNWRSNTDEIIMKAIKLNDDYGKSLLLGCNYRVGEHGKMLTKVEASEFKYNILVTDDRNMGLRSKAIGLTNFPSSWLFEKIEKVSLGRCYD